MTPYHEFRTGLTYQEVSNMVWSHQDDPATWPLAHHTRRHHAILGKWRQITCEMYEQYQQAMEQSAAALAPAELPF